MDDRHALPITIDGLAVITGSVSFMKAEEKDAKSLIILRSEKLAQIYMDTWLGQAGLTAVTRKIDLFGRVRLPWSTPLARRPRTRALHFRPSSKEKRIEIPVPPVNHG